MARLAIKYRLNMTRLATNYKAANTNMCCPLCKREEDNYEHMTRCSEYGQMDNILKLSDLYSEDVQEVRRATEAIKERMDYRCAQPDSWDCQDSRKWRGDLRKKERKWCTSQQTRITIVKLVHRRPLADLSGIIKDARTSFIFVLRILLFLDMLYLVGQN